MPNKLSAAELTAIRERCNRATRGPWEEYEGHIYAPYGQMVASTPYPHENDAFIASSRTDIPALLAEVERLTAERDAAVKDLRNFPGVSPCHVCKHLNRPTLVNGEIDETLPCRMATRECFEWRGNIGDKTVKEDAE